MKLSNKITKLRKSNGWSQEYLAEKLNVSRQAVSRWESETAQPDASNILNLSKLFGVTADYLLNDEYENDSDVPAVKQSQTSANCKIKKIIALCIGILGLIGNFIIYILSRFVEVMVPHITYENGQKMYHWSSDLTGHSYKFFIQEYNLEFLTFIFWIIFLLGFAAAFIPEDKVLAIINKTRKHIKEK